MQADLWKFKLEISWRVLVLSRIKEMVILQILVWRRKLFEFIHWLICMNMVLKVISQFIYWLICMNMVFKVIFQFFTPKHRVKINKIDLHASISKRVVELWLIGWSECFYFIVDYVLKIQFLKVLLFYLLLKNVSILIQEIPCST